VHRSGSHAVGHRFGLLLCLDGETRLPAGKNFLFSVKALSRIFRAKFRDALRQTACLADVPTAVWQQEWVVHCQPVGNGVRALKYLTPYIFRVAISNNRILKLEDGRVMFRYRTSDTGKPLALWPRDRGLRTCTLSAEEFIRRFPQHVLHLSCTLVLPWPCPTLSCRPVQGQDRAGQVQGPRAL
jgi:hypothetical protein